MHSSQSSAKRQVLCGYKSYISGQPLVYAEDVMTINFYPEKLVWPKPEALPYSNEQYKDNLHVMENYSYCYYFWHFHIILGFKFRYACFRSFNT